MWQGNGLEDHIRWNEPTSDFPVVRCGTLFQGMNAFFDDVQYSLFSVTFFCYDGGFRNLWLDAHWSHSKMSIITDSGCHSFWLSIVEIGDTRFISTCSRRLLRDSGPHHPLQGQRPYDGCSENLYKKQGNGGPWPTFPHQEVLDSFGLSILQVEMMPE